jgi:hypothetical protein
MQTFIEDRHPTRLIVSALPRASVSQSWFDRLEVPTARQRPGSSKQQAGLNSLLRTMFQLNE